MIAVIDYDGGNTKSILNVLNRCDIKYIVTYDEKEIISSSKIILYGVSNFAFCMESLKKRKLDKIIKHYIKSEKKPYLGICSGMQVLGHLVKEMLRFKYNSRKDKKIPIEFAKIVPHVGWNKVNFEENILCKEMKITLGFIFVILTILNQIMKKIFL